MTSYNGNMIYYDGMTTLGSFKVGNPTTYNNGTAWTFTWEHGRQLATMTSGGTTWTNTYNSDGLRTSRSDGTTTYTYIYEDGRLSAIKRNDLNMWIIYDDNGPVTLKYGSGTFHYVTNPQGDVVAIVGNQGQKLVEYTYDAWGKVTSITGDYAYNLGIHNPILYRGYVYDHETGMYYCQSRYYDPETGRFLNSDTFAATGQSLIGNNMFAYCGNNPVNRSDTGGYFWDTVFDVVSLCISVADVINNPDDPMAWLGLAADAASLVIPCVSGGGAVVRAAAKADDVVDVVRTIDRVDDVADTARTGWRVGDDITNLTRAGNTPSWSTVRQRFWKNEAFYNAAAYTDEALELMRKGRAPIVDGMPMELHHPNGRIGEDYWDFYPLTHAEHHFEHYGW